jgi:hypothetical protein
MRLSALAIAWAAALAITTTASAQVCWDENPSLVAPPREAHQVCPPRARGAFGFWSRVTALGGVDSYTMPKYASRGYTFTSRFGLTNDFNSGPRLRHYVNYLPVMPYTHPPIYPPVPGGESSAASMQQLGAQVGGSVQIEY